MQLQAIQPRQDWIKTNEQLRFASGGLTARPDTWDEGRVWSDHLCVAISETQAAILHEATQRIHDLCMDTVDGIVKSGDYPTQFGFSDAAIRLIETSWKRGDPLLTGRLDLAFDGVHAPKLLEYNSDNAGLLLETAVLQSQWAHDKQVSQYNSVYRGLVAAWQAAQLFIPAGSAGRSRTAERAPSPGKDHASFQRVFSDGSVLSSAAA